MTLAVAACFPWGRLKDARDSLPPGTDMHQGVILASDSRFTFVDGRVSDQGRKLYVLSPDAAMVFAGDIVALQDALTFYSHLGKRTVAAGDPARAFPLYLRKAYER